MISSNHDLVLVRLLRQPCQLCLDLGEGAPDAEVAGVEE